MHYGPLPKQKKSKINCFGERCCRSHPRNSHCFARSQQKKDIKKNQVLENSDLCMCIFYFSFRHIHRTAVTIEIVDEITFRAHS